jgi:hypothetical protein
MNIKFIGTWNYYVRKDFEEAAHGMLMVSGAWKRKTDFPNIRCPSLYTN